MDNVSKRHYISEQDLHLDLISSEFLFFFSKWRDLLNSLDHLITIRSFRRFNFSTCNHQKNIYQHDMFASILFYLIFSLIPILPFPYRIFSQIPNEFICVPILLRCSQSGLFLGSPPTSSTVDEFQFPYSYDLCFCKKSSF